MLVPVQSPVLLLVTFSYVISRQGEERVSHDEITS